MDRSNQDTLDVISTDGRHHTRRWRRAQSCASLETFLDKMTATDTGRFTYVLERTSY